MKVAVFGLVFLFSLGATAQGRAPQDDTPAARRSLASASALAAPGLVLGVVLGLRRVRRPEDLPAEMKSNR